MHVRRMFLGAAIALAIVATLPSTASADWTFSPFIGATFNGSLNDQDLDQATSNHLSWGGSLAYMGAGIAGFELDFGYSPEFFHNDPDNGDPDIDFLGSGNVTTLMANAIFGAPIGGMERSVRPYAVAGVGLIRQKVDDVDDVFDIDDNSFGFNLGGGVMGMFSDNVGIRGDIRYFRSFRNDSGDGIDDLDFDLTGLSFWRGTVGVTFRFGS
jgi:opacity protein-like surface antigen